MMRSLFNMSYKDKLVKAVKKHFLEELSTKDISISEDLTKFLIPTLLDCIDKSLDKSIVDMKRFIVSEVSDSVQEGEDVIVKDKE